VLLVIITSNLVTLFEFYMILTGFMFLPIEIEKFSRYFIVPKRVTTHLG